MSYQSFELLKKLYFVRTSGSDEELKAANLLKQECLSLGVEAKIEPFEVDSYRIKKASLKIDGENKFDFVGVGITGSTGEEGIQGEFIYIDSLKALEMFSVLNKIVLIEGKKASHKMYKMLVEKGAKGLIVTTGSVYQDNQEVDLDPYQLRESDYSLGKIPSLCISNHDAEQLVVLNPKMISMVLLQEEFKIKSHNVIAEIKGSDFPNEIICFSAHYDSVPFSKGIYDNATGTTTIMQMLAYYQQNPPKRTLRFIFCGSEEQGLLGSKFYCQSHQEDLKNILFDINVDMTGVTLGHDIACVSGEVSICHYIQYLSSEVGFPIETRQDVYSSDSTPFADQGIPSVTFARLAKPTGAVIHCHDDVIERLSAPNYYATCRFIQEFSSRLINAYRFPIQKVIPDNIKLELDYYMLRKERP